MSQNLEDNVIFEFGSSCLAVQVLDHALWKVGMGVHVAHVQQAKLPLFVFPNCQRPASATPASRSPAVKAAKEPGSDEIVSPNKRKLQESQDSVVSPKKRVKALTSTAEEPAKSSRSSSFEPAQDNGAAEVRPVA